eukprot:g5545.t1
MKLISAGKKLTSSREIQQCSNSNRLILVLGTPEFNNSTQNDHTVIATVAATVGLTIAVAVCAFRKQRCTPKSFSIVALSSVVIAALVGGTSYQRRKSAKLREEVASCYKRASSLGACYRMFHSPRFLSDFIVFRAVNEVIQMHSASRTHSNLDKTMKKKKDPFHQPDPGLMVRPYIGAKSQHSLLLNKFPPFHQSLLIITRDFAPQTDLLTVDDFSACLEVLDAIDGLAFFNCGPQSGASQKHKHLQIIPKSQIPSNQFPFEKLISKVKKEEGKPFLIPTYNFPHGCILIASRIYQTMEKRAEHLLEIYQTLLTTSGVMTQGQYFDYLHKAGTDFMEQGSETNVFPSHNVLFTREYMLIAPRAKVCWEMDNIKIGTNSLGLAGVLLVWNDETFEALSQSGPLTVLKDIVGEPHCSCLFTDLERKKNDAERKEA